MGHGWSEVDVSSADANRRGQFGRERNLGDKRIIKRISNNKYRMLNDEGRDAIDFIDLKDRAYRFNPSKICPPPAEIFCGSAVCCSILLSLI